MTTNGFPSQRARGMEKRLALWWKNVTRNASKLDDDQQAAV